MLPTYQNILIATDLTPNCVFAFKHAVMLARESKAKVHLLHVVPEVDAGFRSYVSAVMGSGILEKFEAQHEEEARAEIRKELEEFTKEELADHPEDFKNIVSIQVLHGHAVSHILQEAERLNADVIVMGTHGKGALQHTFLGSVTEKVLRRSKRPVFVVPIPD
ncbi:MAG: universal stress protein [Desulfuromonadales bacterium]|nr:universal stress protein [Desulfuromonadales bacterium]